MKTISVYCNEYRFLTGSDNRGWSNIDGQNGKKTSHNGINNLIIEHKHKHEF